MFVCVRVYCVKFDVYNCMTVTKKFWSIEMIRELLAAGFTNFNAARCVHMNVVCV